MCGKVSVCVRNNDNNNNNTRRAAPRRFLFILLRVASAGCSRVAHAPYCAKSLCCAW